MKCPACHSECWKCEGEEIYCTARTGILGVCLYHLNEAEKWQYEHEQQECLFEVQKSFEQKIDYTPRHILIREKLRLLEQGSSLKRIAEIDLQLEDKDYHAEHQVIYREKQKIKEPELF